MAAMKAKGGDMNIPTANTTMAAKKAGIKDTINQFI
jgi:hypothetical protein